MKNLRRRALPNYAILNDTFNIDVEKLKESYYYGIKTNKEKNLNHHLSINSTEDPEHPRYFGTDDAGYEQINLTSYNLENSADGYFKSKWQWFARNETMTANERKSFYRKNLKATKDSVYSTLETSYSQITELADDYLKEVLSKFNGKVTRVRWAVANPDFHLRPHIDYDTIHAVRYHFPILTNDDCFFYIKRDSEVDRVHMPADGRAWFINPGFTHWVENNGTTPRVHLIVTVVGQDDLVGFTTNVT